jgi:hypothetical protein
MNNMYYNWFSFRDFRLNYKDPQRQDYLELLHGVRLILLSNYQSTERNK